MREKKLILDLCGGTGSWSRPYVENGYEVRVIDPICGGVDVRLFWRTEEKVYGILAAPPCTDFSSSGAQYWRAKDGDGRTLQSLSIVDACLRIVLIHNPTFWCLENPVGRLRDWLGPPAMYFDPCDFGRYSSQPLRNAYTKKTCLWGKFNPPIPNKIDPLRVCSQGSWIQRLGGSSRRTKMLRSITPDGFAWAFFEANR